MTDDRILSVEEVRYLPAWKQATAIRLARSHEALRARLTAAEERAERAEREARQEAEFRDDLCNAILEHAPEMFDGDESADTIAVRYVRWMESMQPGMTAIGVERLAELESAEAERDQAIKERDERDAMQGPEFRHYLAMKDDLTAAEAQVAALTEALRACVPILNGVGWPPGSTEALRLTRAALAAADQTDEGDK